MTPLLLAVLLGTPAQPPVLPAPARVEPALPVPVALTLADFSRAFAPLPGRHEVWIVHPSTKQPVLVCFTLPPGRMKRFEVEDRDIEFHFDKCEVRIEFRKNGKVDVVYDD
ncbi:MAG TPA: hypothetical protein VM529_00020 [Gemmata sp.]|nr:hypothetical protein [Gemmata sp.]